MIDFVKDNKWKIITGVVAAVFAIAFISSVSAAELDRAPASVNQERLLDAGETEFFYTYSNELVVNDTTSTHAFGGLWAPFNFVTVGTSTDYRDASENSFGDVFLHGVTEVNFFGLEVRPSLGVSIPNGFTTNNVLLPVVDADTLNLIDDNGSMPRPDPGTVPPPVVDDPVVNNSSGTFDLQPALTVVADVGQNTGVEVGAQYVGVFRTGTNDLGFRYGDENTAKAWVSVQPVEFASVYGLVEAQFVGNSEGTPVLVGSSEAVRVGAGAHVYAAGFRVSGEVTVPVHESYQGLRNSFDEARVFRVGVQRTF